MADEQGKLDLEKLRERQPPLAELIDAVMQSNTKRDNPLDIADDLSIGLTARDDSSEVGAAFAEFEKSISPQALAGRKAAQGGTRRQLKERLRDEIEGE